MVFPKKYAEAVARLRVPAGFALAAVFAWLARPTPESLAAGGALGLLGLALRAWAAGHLRKDQALTDSGPYAHVRNPLYLGTLITGAGFAIAGARLWIGVLMVAFFALVYVPVIEEEEKHLARILPGYAGYRRSVPRVWPRLWPAQGSARRFDPALYRKNREYQAFEGFLAVMAALTAKWYFGL